MSARQRQPSTKHTIPENAEFFQIPVSDGDSNTWPSHTTRIVDSDGHVNFMFHCDLDHSMNKKWRVEVGRAISLKLEYPEGKAYVLEKFPDGYRMFDHHKGKADAPRHDVYLFGPPGKRFRSIPEFIPHAIWLMTDKQLDPRNCNCKYCSKRAQKDITYQMADVMPKRTPTHSPGPSRRPMNDSKPKKPSQLRVPYTAVQRAPIPAKLSRVPCLADRNADLRAIHCQNSMQLKRWFRPGELLWCTLNPSIPGPNGALDGIKFWPGLVVDTKLKNDIRPLPPTQPSGRDDAPPWTVSQSTIYKIKLLAVDFEMDAFDEQVLPYQAYVVPPATIDALQTANDGKLDLDEGRMLRMNPCPSVGVADFNESVSAYAVALQIASRLSDYWCLTDEWEQKLTIPPAARPLAPSLAEAIMQAHTLGTPSSQPFPNTSSPDPNMSTAEFNATSSQIMGTPPNGQVMTQMQYQGLWWGAERIWVEDFVRLKVPRRCLAPGGAQNIYAPAGPGKSLLESWDASSSRKTAEFGAASRGVFMRIDALILVNTTAKNGTPKKECRACGMLYELADHDFEESPTNGTSGPSTPRFDPVPGPSTNGASSSNQYSHPSTSNHYPLPAPPTGFKFRQILPDGYQAVMSLTMISGRYYPSMLQHPLLHETLQTAMSHPEGGSLTEYSYLWAIEGLTPGYYNSVDPVVLKKSREWMLKDADKEARRELGDMVESRSREQAMAMEVEDDSGSVQGMSTQMPVSPSAPHANGSSSSTTGIGLMDMSF